jgi:serine phosphatase RsbU (regulator of sigma subunit)
VQARFSTTRQVVWVCALALAIFAAGLAVHPGPNTGLAFFYAIPVGLAAWWLGPRAGFVAVAGCAVLYLLVATVHPVAHVGLVAAVRLVALIGVATVVSLLRKRVLALEHSAEELEAIRAALTPATLPLLPGVDAAATFVPSEFGVSGDFYLLTNGPDRSTVAIVGDVVGHGPEAARLATFVRARFAALAAGTSDPVELLTLANLALFDRPDHERDLVSAVCLRFDPTARRLIWATAGHPPPLRLPQLGELGSPATTYLLGAEADLRLSNSEASLSADDGVLVYTDGATDVRGEEGMLGLAGLAQLISPLAKLPARAMASAAQRAILEWAVEPIRDDLCLLVLKPKRPAGSRTG